MMGQVLRTIVLLVVGTAALAASESGGTPGERSESARGVSDGFVDAWNRHDVAAFAALYAENADFVNVLGVWLRGSASLEAYDAARLLWPTHSYK